MELNREDLSRLKETEFEMLKAFDELCKTLNLKYYLLGGTLLGAVRHKGFIPWDDDIDVGMLREDYEVFIKCAQSLLPPELFVQNFYTDPEFPHNFTKIRNSNTTFIETPVRNQKINHGVFIDIFPLDYYPEKPRAVKWFNIRNKWLSRAVRAYFYMPHVTAVPRVRAIDAVMKMMYPSVNKLIRKREKLYTAFKSGTRIANYSGAWGAKEIVPSEWYDTGAELEFEGLRTIGPKHYEKWLTQVYGDYMQLPPVEKRKGHHYTDAVSFDRPYTDFIGGHQK